MHLSGGVAITSKKGHKYDPKKKFAITTDGIPL
jgi:hypothetical protein